MDAEGGAVDAQVWRLGHLDLGNEIADRSDPGNFWNFISD
jgi:hypothetical protein